MSLSMWLPMVYIYFFIWWWLHLTYNVRSWINEAMETNSCSMKHIFISELGIYFVFLCTCILCALYVLIKPYKHDLWINVEDMIFRCIWYTNCMGNLFLKKKILHQIIIMIINLHYICINLSNWPYALSACLHVRLHTWITTYQCLLYLLYNIMTCMHMPL